MKSATSSFCDDVDTFRQVISMLGILRALGKKLVFFHRNKRQTLT